MKLTATQKKWLTWIVIAIAIYLLWKWYKKKQAAKKLAAGMTTMPVGTSTPLETVNIGDTASVIVPEQPIGSNGDTLAAASVSRITDVSPDSYTLRPAALNLGGALAFKDTGDSCRMPDGSYGVWNGNYNRCEKQTVAIY